jgi:DNA-binding NtrC family response regulator
MILGDSQDSLDDMLIGNGGRSQAAALSASEGRLSSPLGLLQFDPNDPPDLASLSLKKIKKQAIVRVEKEIISYVLEKTGWNRSKATKILNISYKTLLYKIKNLGIEPPQGSKE